MLKWVADISENVVGESGCADAFSGTFFESFMVFRNSIRDYDTVGKVHIEMLVIAEPSLIREHS